MLHSLWNDGRAQPPFRYISADSVIDSASALERFPWEWAFTSYRTIATQDPRDPQNVLFIENFPDSTNRFSSTNETGTAPAHWSISGGQLTASITAGLPSNNYFFRNNAHYNSPIFWIEDSVIFTPTNDNPGSDNAGLVFLKDNLNSYTWKSTATGIIQLEGFSTGTYFTWGSIHTGLTGNIRLALSKVGSTIIGWYDSAGTWKVGIRGTDITSSRFDLTVYDSIADWCVGAGAYAPASTNFVVHIQNLQAIDFGYTGNRDMRPVTNLDGSPWLNGDTIYLTMSSSDPSGRILRGGTYFGFYTWNVTNFAIQKIGDAFVNRSGYFMDDHAGQVIRTSYGKFEWVLTGFGNDYSGANVEMFYGDTLDSLFLHHRNVLSNFDTLRITDPDYYGIDPFMYYDSMDGLWRVVYTPSYPASTSGIPQVDNTKTLSAVWNLEVTLPFPNWTEGNEVLPVAGTHLYSSVGPLSNASTNQLASFHGFTRPEIDNIVTGKPTAIQPWQSFIPYNDSIYSLSFDTTTQAGVNYTWGSLILGSSPRYRN
jgi:hypothetical protein